MDKLWLILGEDAGLRKGHENCQDGAWRSKESQDSAWRSQKSQDGAWRSGILSASLCS
ncbi:MAG: hypothetical protein R6U55_09185 [Desulfovermiculus sp.]